MSLLIERRIQAVVLRNFAVTGHAAGHRRVIEDHREIDSARFPVFDRGLHVEHVHASDHLVELLEAQLCHILTDLFSDKEKEVDDVLWCNQVNFLRSSGSCVAMPTEQVLR